MTFRSRYTPFQLILLLVLFSYLHAYALEKGLIDLVDVSYELHELCYFLYLVCFPPLRWSNVL